MSFAIDNNRDRNFSRIMSRLCSSNSIAVEITNEKIGHRVFERLVERGELAPYLARTIFAEMDDELIPTERENVIMNFPTTRIRPYDSLT